MVRNTLLLTAYNIKNESRLSVSDTMLISPDRALYIEPNGKLKRVKKPAGHHGIAFIYSGKFYEHHSYAVYDVINNCIIWMTEYIPTCTARFGSEAVVIYMGWTIAGDPCYWAVNLIGGSEYCCADFCRAVLK